MRRVRLGAAGSVPVTGDWNGDGRTDLAAYAAGSWSLWSEGAGGRVVEATVALGGPGDLPVAGDWNGNGTDDLGVWDPGSGLFTLRTAGPMREVTGMLRTVDFGRPR